MRECLEEFEYPLDFHLRDSRSSTGSDDLDCDADEVLTVRTAHSFPTRISPRRYRSKLRSVRALLGGLPRTLPEMRKEAARRSVLVLQRTRFSRDPENGRRSDVCAIPWRMIDRFFRSEKRRNKNIEKKIEKDLI